MSEFSERVLKPLWARQPSVTRAYLYSAAVIFVGVTFYDCVSAGAFGTGAEDWMHEDWLSHDWIRDAPKLFALLAMIYIGWTAKAVSDRASFRHFREENNSLREKLARFIKPGSESRL